MDDKIKGLPAKAQLQRRALHLVLTCAIVLIINHLVTPGLNWSLWVVGGLVIAFLYDLIDFFIIHRNTKE